MTTPSPRGRGALVSPPDARDFRFDAAHYGAPAPGALPVAVDLRGGANPTRLRPVGRPTNQGQLNACVGFSLERQRAALRVAAGAPPLDFGPTLTWTEARSTEGSLAQNVGVDPRDAYVAAVKIGTPPLSVYPPTYATALPDAPVLNAARIYRIGSFHLLQSLTEIKQSLAARCPVVVTVPAGADFEACPPSGIMTDAALAYREYDHEQIIAGYDAWWLYFMGTWGEQWAQSGYYYVPINAFDTGFCITPWSASLKVAA